MAPALCLSVCVIKVGCHMSVVKVDSIFSLCTKNCQSAWGERHGGGGGAQVRGRGVGGAQVRGRGVGGAQVRGGGGGVYVGLE